MALPVATDDWIEAWPSAFSKLSLALMTTDAEPDLNKIITSAKKTSHVTAGCLSFQVLFFFFALVVLLIWETGPQAFLP